MKIVHWPHSEKSHYPLPCYLCYQDQEPQLLPSCSLSHNCWTHNFDSHHDATHHQHRIYTACKNKSADKSSKKSEFLKTISKHRGCDKEHKLIVAHVQSNDKSYIHNDNNSIKWTNMNEQMTNTYSCIKVLNYRQQGLLNWNIYKNGNEKSAKNPLQISYQKLIITLL